MSLCYVYSLANNHGLYILSQMARKELSIFIIFLIHIHVLMLCRKFELILIKIRFLMNFKSCSKIRPKTIYYSTGSLTKFCEKWLGENSSFL